jgi:hypothetical protein
MAFEQAAMGEAAGKRIPHMVNKTNKILDAPTQK